MVACGPELIGAVDDRYPPAAFALAPDGAWFAAAGDQTMITQVAGGATRVLTKGWDPRAVSADAATVIASRHDGALSWLDGIDGTERARVDLGSARDRVTAAALSADGRTLVVGTARGVVMVFSISGPPHVR
jgi:hypothetical protein